MDKQQYENMQRIMTLSRQFCDQIHGMMEDFGLIEQGFALEIDIRDEVYNGDDPHLSSIKLQKNICKVDIDEYHATRFSEWHTQKKGWQVYDNPLEKPGDIPEDTHDFCKIVLFHHLTGSEDGDAETGETAEADAESGNSSMWFHDDGGDPPMVCRGDLNGSMAESDPGI